MAGIERRLRSLEERHGEATLYAPTPEMRRALEDYFAALAGEVVPDRGHDPQMEAYFGELAEHERDVVGLEKRIQDLEHLYNMAAHEVDAEERERLEAKMRANLARAEEMAAAEEAEGNLNRRHALDSIYRFMNREAD